MSETQEPFETELLLIHGVHADPVKVHGTFMKQGDLVHSIAMVRDFLMNYADLETIRNVGGKAEERHLSLREYQRIIEQTFLIECSQERYFQILKRFHLFVPYYIEHDGYIGYSSGYRKTYLRPYLLLVYALFIAPLDPKAGTVQIALQALDEAIRSYKTHTFGVMEEDMKEAFLYCRYQMIRYADHPLLFFSYDLSSQDNEGKR